jgi:hypothetical protein
VKILLRLEQQRQLLHWAGAHTSAEVDAGVEPGGYVLEIDVGLFVCARARCGDARLELGEVELEQRPMAT